MTNLDNEVDFNLQRIRSMVYSLYEFQDEGCQIRDEITDKIILAIESLDELLLTCNVTKILEE